MISGYEKLCGCFADDELEPPASLDWSLDAPREQLYDFSSPELKTKISDILKKNRELVIPSNADSTWSREELYDRGL